MTTGYSIYADKVGLKVPTGITRSMLSKSKDWVSVLDFGGNTANDTTAVQAAFTAAANGGTVYFPLGTYTFDTINVPSGVTVTGPGRIIQRTAGQRTFSLSGVNDVTFNGINWTGKAAATSGVATSSGSNEAIYTSTSNRVNVLNSYFTRSLNHALSANVGTDINFSNNQIDYCAHGTNFTGVNRGQIIGNRLHQTCLYSVTPTTNQFAIGIRMDSTDVNGTASPLNPICTDIVVANNVIDKYPYAQGIMAHAGQRLSITGNVVDGCSVGISLNPYNIFDNLQYASITGNHITGNAGASTLPGSPADTGIVVQGGPGNLGTTPVIQNVSVSGNSIFGANRVANDPGQGGMMIGYTTGVTVSGNSIYGCSCNGIVATSTEEGLVIVGNTISNILNAAATQNAVYYVGSPISLCASNSFTELGTSAGTGVRCAGVTTNLLKASNHTYNVTTP